MATPGAERGPVNLRDDLVLLAVLLLVLILTNTWLLWDGHIVWGAAGAGTMLSAGITLGMYSFLYRDNSLYKAAEHIYVGLAAGYAVIVVWYNVFLSEFVEPARQGDWQMLAVRVVPFVLGVMLALRVSRRFGWLSRYSFAFVVGLFAGISIPLTIDAYMLKQMSFSVAPLWSDGMTWAVALKTIVGLVGLVSVLIYFFYSVEHRGAVGVVSKVGIYFLMVSFGASFGFTVMARLTLFVGRLQFLLGDWLGITGK